MYEGILKDIDDFIALLIPNSRGGTQFNIRCPICGDSARNSNAKRLYISKEPPFLYCCHNCECSGRFDAKLIHKLIEYNNLIDYDSSALINQLHKFGVSNAFNYNVPLSYDYIKHLSLDKPSYLKSKNIDKGLQYLEKRLGYEFDDTTITKQQIILDPINFLNRNKMVFLQLFKGPNGDRIKKNINLLLSLIKQGTQFIGFITSDNAKLIFRSITDSKFRYINIKLLTKNSVYVLKSDNLSFNDKIRVSICEGVFDCISAYKNFSYDISIASLNSNYVVGIYELMALGVHYDNCQIDIIVDNDDTGRRSMKSRSIIDMKKLFNIRFLTNIKGKDIGIRIEDIDLVELY